MGYVSLQVLRRRVLLCGSLAAVADFLVACANSAPSSPPLPTATSAASPTPTPQPQIDVRPATPLVDEAVAIHLTGFMPQQEMTLHLRTTDDAGIDWESSALFRTDARGAIDVATQAPLSGSYTGIDPMGLFWSMNPPPPKPALLVFTLSGATIPPATLTAEIGGTVIATAAVNRRLMGDGVTRTEIRDNGLVGTLSLPPGPGPFPGLIYLKGSSVLPGGGGIYEPPAALLASHGYATLALAYYGIPPLPPDLVDVPLEYVESAIGWMQAQTQVRSDRLGVIGSSRGGELSLLVGATFPQVKAVVAYVPSGIIRAGQGRKGAWTYQGVELPYTPVRILNVDPDNPAVIRVERTEGPILIIAADADTMWQSTPQSQVAMDRLARFHHPYLDQFLHYAGADHEIGFPNVPLSLVSTQSSSTATEAASSDSWPKMLAFLAQCLGE